MKRQTLKKFDRYAFVGAVMAIAVFLLWFLTATPM